MSDSKDDRNNQNNNEKENNQFAKDKSFLTMLREQLLRLRSKMGKLCFGWNYCAYLFKCR